MPVETDTASLTDDPGAENSRPHQTRARASATAFRHKGAWKMVPEEDSKQRKIWQFSAVYRDSGQTEGPQNSPQNGSKLLVRCLFRDSKIRKWLDSWRPSSGTETGYGPELGRHILNGTCIPKSRKETWDLLDLPLQSRECATTRIIMYVSAEISTQSRSLLEHLGVAIDEAEDIHHQQTWSGRDLFRSPMRKIAKHRLHVSLFENREPAVRAQRDERRR